MQTELKCELFLAYKLLNNLSRLNLKQRLKYFNYLRQYDVIYCFIVESLVIFIHFLIILLLVTFCLIEGCAVDFCDSLISLKKNFHNVEQIQIPQKEINKLIGSYFVKCHHLLRVRFKTTNQLKQKLQTISSFVLVWGFVN